MVIFPGSLACWSEVSLAKRNVDYLSQCAELHNDPHWVFCDDTDQFHDVRMVKLTHCYCRGRMTETELLKLLAIRTIMEQFHLYKYISIITMGFLSKLI